MRTYKTVKASQQARLREALAINFIPKGYVHINGVGDVAQEVAPKITSLLTMSCAATPIVRRCCICWAWASRSASASTATRSEKVYTRLRTAFTGLLWRVN